MSVGSSAGGPEAGVPDAATRGTVRPESASPPLEPPARDAPLARWLDYIGALHPVGIDLGLERVARVADRLGLRRPPLAIVIVGGTNGKGSTVAMLEAIWTAAGHRTGATISPHVARFNERLRVAGVEAGDAEIVRALAAVDAARGADTLTYFEFTTLAAMWHFVARGCAVAILEVGLGGRLDATNLWDADCAVLTSIALDHAEWLGGDRDAIAIEKAAIGRRGRPLVVGDPDPPESLLRFAAERGIEPIALGDVPVDSLPRTSLAGTHQRRNAACALAVARLMNARLPVDGSRARAALLEVGLPARFEELAVAGRTVVLDVAHNPAAATVLSETWRARFGERRADLVFAALADKDIEGIVGALAPRVARWRCAALEGERALPAATLVARVRAALARCASPTDRAPVEPYASVERALAAALAVDGAATDDTIADGAWAGGAQARSGTAPVLVAGSFLTVAAARATLDG